MRFCDPASLGNKYEHCLTICTLALCSDLMVIRYESAWLSNLYHVIEKVIRLLSLFEIGNSLFHCMFAHTWDSTIMSVCTLINQHPVSEHWNVWATLYSYRAEKANFCLKLCTTYSKVHKLVMACEMMGSNPRWKEFAFILYSSGQVRRNFLSFCIFMSRKYKISVREIYKLDLR